MRQAVLAFAVLFFVSGSGGAQETEQTTRDLVMELNNVTGDDAIIGKVRELRKDRTTLRKMLAEGKLIAKEKPKNQPLSYTASYILARSAQSIKEYEAGEFYYKLCLEQAFKLRSTQKVAQTFDGLIDLFDRMKKYDDAFFTCQKFLELKGSDDEDDQISRSKPFVIEKMIIILCQKKEYDKALEMTEKMIEADKGGWYFLHRKAEVLREAGKYDEAAKLFESVIEKLAENDRLNNDDKDRFTDQCKYLLSSVYLDQGHLDKSVKVLEELVKRRPDTAGFANDLGYVLADHDQRLDEAQQLIEKALKLDTEAKKKALDEGRVSEDDVGENAAYLDSLAWVLFKKKEYAKALELMEKVIKDEESQHVEIYDHYAEVLLANGRKDDAIKAWEKALSFDEVTRRDGPRKEAVRKKLEKHTK